MLEYVEINPENGAPNYSVIWLHGLGADGYNFVPIVDELHLPQNEKIRFIFPHAPIRPVTLNHGVSMRAWFDIIDLTLEGRLDEEGLLNASHEIEQFIQQEVRRGIPMNHIFIAGFSQGGALALYTALRYQHRLAGIIALSTYLPLREHHIKELTPANIHTPIFFAHGIYDPVIPYAWGEKSKNSLADKGYPITWHRFEMEHEVDQECVVALGAWLKEQCQ